ncbi:protein kinase domain-containing protein [Ditylenchus destructor]|uniref:Protein kinase domain-containing protein n=1 Tax=Ditylenchus destructor TaxID=166010 RepID=A0AAD4MWA7_9BILA|nr:protein kinase domain-containing protein [Ditylenchus destructor]
MDLTLTFVLKSLLIISLSNCVNGQDFLSKYNAPLDYTKSSMKEFSTVKDLKKLPHKVTLVLCNKTSVYYVLKEPSVIHRYKVTFPPSEKEYHFDSVEHEIRLMQAINHPLIVRMPHYFTNEGHPYMVIDYVEGGTLAELINTLGALDEWHIRFYLGQILSATKHLHDHGVTHGDLFNVNIMLDKRGNVKIIDFERSMIFFGTTRNAARESAGSTSIETKVVP